MRASVTEETAKLLTSYAYDKVGNRTQKVENGVTTTYSYNSLNQLRNESGADTLTYAYNGNGQPISVSGSGITKTYAYTPAGMLASYTSGSTTQKNLCNGDGQRVQKKEGSAVTNYFYQNGSVLYTTDSAGALKAFYLLNVSDAFATTIWNRKDRLDGLSFLLDRVDKQDFADISKAEVSEIYLHVSQPTRKRLAFFC